VKPHAIWEAIPRGGFRTFALASIMALGGLRASAGIEFAPPSPEELQLTSEARAPGAPAIILFREVDRDDNGRTSHEDNYVRINPRS
jgi:hypothetical protein